MIHQKPTFVNSHNHPLVAQLAARLNAGAHERCASCLNWSDKKHCGAVAVYVPYDGRPHVGYVLCKRCVRGTNVSAEQQADLTKLIEIYLDGETDTK